MDCRETRKAAEAFVREGAAVANPSAVLAHLDLCPSCRAEFDGLRRLRAATRLAFERMADLKARPEFGPALASRLLSETPRRRPARASGRLWLSIAAGVLLLVGAGLGWREWATSGLSALLHAAVGDHRFCALDFKLTEMPMPLDEATRRHGGVYGLLDNVEPSTPALSGNSLQVVERHSCVFEGRRFAHIVLLYKKETVSVLVTDDPRPGSAMWARLPGMGQALSGLSVTDGFHVASFREARHVVFVVSASSRRDVQDVARAMAGPLSKALAGA